MMSYSLYLLKGQKALVLEANSGMGEVLARCLAIAPGAIETQINTSFTGLVAR